MKKLDNEALAYLREARAQGIKIKELTKKLASWGYTKANGNALVYTPKLNTYLDSDDIRFILDANLPEILKKKLVNEWVKNV